MLHGKIFVLHALGDLFRFHQGLLHIVGDVDLAGLPAGTGDAGRAVQVFLQAADKRGYGNTAFGQKLGDEFALILGQGEHQMLLLHLHMLIFDGKRLGPLQGIDCLLRELIHIHRAYLL